MTVPADDLQARLEGLVVPIDGSVPGGGVGDLRPLADVLADKQVVGLGEATHGTREFFQLKHRLVRLLVTELDVRLFGLEADFAAALAVNDYVVAGEGDPRDALSGLGYWTTRTEELLALVEWLRAFNSGRPDGDRVRFYGYDVGSGRRSASAIGEFLRRVDPDYFDEVAADVETVATGVDGDDFEAVKEWLVAAETVGTLLADRFDQHGDRYRRETSDREWRLARRHRRLVEQAVELRAARTFEDRGSPNGVRDAAMAENVSWLLDHARADRMALWAHNGHVATGRFRVGEWDDPPKTMGQHLREALGDDYYALGFEFGRGSFRARPDPETTANPAVGTFSLAAPPEGSVAATLTQVDGPAWFIDVETASDDSVVDEWLREERLLHSVGAVFFDDAAEEYVPVEVGAAFDGLAFVAETTTTVPLGGE